MPSVSVSAPMDKLVCLRDKGCTHSRAFQMGIEMVLKGGVSTLDNQNREINYLRNKIIEKDKKIAEFDKKMAKFEENRQELFELREKIYMKTEEKV